MNDEPKRPVRPDIKVTSLWYDPWYAPFLYLEWKFEWVVYIFSKLAFFKILEYAAKLAILVALINYIYEAPQRERQAELNAWQVINSAQGQKGASGRVEALEYLHENGVDLNFLDVNGAYLPQINLSKAKLKEANFNDSKLLSANFHHASLFKAGLSGAYLNGANFTRANLDVANLERAELWYTNLRRASLRQANLKEADLRGANLYRANLKGADLRITKYVTPDQLCEAETLYNASMEVDLLADVKELCPYRLGGDYVRERLSGGNFASHNMSYADLRKAKLVNTNLEGAYLTDADLKGANLEGANLEYANLEGANLEYASLRVADLRRAKNLTPDQLCQAETLYEATMDTDLFVEVEQQCPDKLEPPEPE